MFYACFDFEKKHKKFKGFELQWPKKNQIAEEGGEQEEVQAYLDHAIKNQSFRKTND